MDYLKIYRESKQKYYKFYLEWNTGDPWWDNEPEDEIFYGTIEELKDHLDCEIPLNFEEQLLTGDKIYDDGGETWSAQIAEKVSYEDCVRWREEQEAKRKAEEEERKRKEQEFRENNWTSKEEAIEAVQSLINVSSFTQASPTKNHPDRVMHFKDCGLILQAGSDFYRTKYSILIITSSSSGWYSSAVLREAGSDAEVYATWVDQLKRGPRERHETWARSGGGGTVFTITKKNFNQFKPE